MMLIKAGVISGFDDAAGLQRFLDKAKQLESNFVSVSDASLAQEKKELAGSKAKYEQLTTIVQRTEKAMQESQMLRKETMEIEMRTVEIQKILYAEKLDKLRDQEISPRR